MDVAKSVHELFPDVTEAVEQYQQTKLDREARNLARRVRSEEALYDQFLRRLAILSYASPGEKSHGLLRSVEEKYGDKAAQRLRNDLRLMEDSLSSLKADLDNASRGTEMLSKIRRKPVFSRGHPRDGPLQKRLADVSKANKRLQVYLVDGHASLPVLKPHHATLNYHVFARQGQNEPGNGISISAERFSCSCQRSLTRVASQIGNTPGINASTRSIQEDTHGADVSREMEVKDIRDFSEHVSFSLKDDLDGQSMAVDHRDDGQMTPMSRTSDSNHPYGKKIRLTMSGSTPPQRLITIDRLVAHQTLLANHKRRLELAFHLSSALLFLWAFDERVRSDRWKAWDMLFDPQEDAAAWHFYIQPRTFTTRHLSHEAGPSTTFQALCREPSITLLGLRLIELAFGRTLTQMRRVGLVLGIEADGQDQDVLDLLTAKRLLGLRQIGEQFGQPFEDVINVCVNQQYRESKGAHVWDVNFRNESFMRPAASMILQPLYEGMRKNHGCTCNSIPPAAGAPGQDVDRPQGRTQVSLEPPMATSVPKSLTAGALQNFATPTAEDRTDDGSHRTSQPGSITGKQCKDYGTLGAKPPSNTPQESSGDLHHSLGKLHMEGASPSPFSIAHAHRDGRGDGVMTGSSAEDGRMNPEQSATRSALTETSAENIDEPMEDDAPDDDVDSMDSYGTMTRTMTTDSAFAYLSEHSDVPPILPDNHVLSHFEGIATRIMLRQYITSTNRGTGVSGEASGTPRRTNDRKRQRDKGKGRDIHNEDEAGSRPGIGGSNKKRRMNEGKATFACPFFKKNPMGHGRCCTYILSRIRDVKQHLHRCHQMGIYCSLCFQTFAHEIARDEHTQNSFSEGGSCAQNRRPRPEGIHEDQRNQLARKVPASQSPEEQWYGIFDILFPGYQPRPDSPYVENGLMSNVLKYQGFVQDHGPRILSDVLTASGAVSWTLPPSETDMAAFQARVLGEGIRQLYERWTSSGGLASTTGEPGTDPPVSEALSSTANENDENESVTTPSNFTTASSSHESSGMSWDHAPEHDWAQRSQGNAQVGGMYDPITSEDTQDILNVFQGFGQPSNPWYYTHPQR